MTTPALLHRSIMTAALLILAPMPSSAQADEATESATAAPAVARMAPSGDGTLVIDPRARLAWARCVEGMHWNGKTCTGRPQLLTYKQAQALVKERNQAEGARWRLPRVNELRRLVNRSANPPSVDQALFPAAPADWHWTGTSSVNAGAVNPYAYGNVMRGGAGGSTLAVQQGWAVDMATGNASGEASRTERLVVRLVRPAP
jgi:hypothetical protein